MDGALKHVSDFRSPLRVLAASFRKSRDQWKRKCTDAKVDRKRLQVRVADVSKSRDAWRHKAETHERELQALQAQVERLQQQLTEAHTDEQK